MDQYLNIVLSQAPLGVSDVEFNTWYDRHLLEILAIPGYVAARRYAIAQAGAAIEQKFTYMSLYQLNRPPAEVAPAMDAAVASGVMQFPSWFDQIQFLSWDGTAVGEKVTGQS